jgi:hypothetical protein
VSRFVRGAFFDFGAVRFVFVGFRWLSFFERFLLAPFFAAAAFVLSARVAMCVPPSARL